MRTRNLYISIMSFQSFQHLVHVFFAICFCMVATLTLAAPAPIDVDAACTADANKHPIANAGRLSCQAVIAVYVDRDGHFLYMENIEQDPTRLVRITPWFSTGGACAGGASCFVCVTPSRCGCRC